MAGTMMGRHRVSRETRLLFVTVVVALVALWGLARLRFPGRASTPNPVPAVLTSLTPPSSFEDLALAVSQAAPEITPSVVALPGGGDAEAARVGIRLREDVVVVYVPPQAATTRRPLAPPGELIAHDAGAGIAVFRMPEVQVPVLATWTPRRASAPRYLLSGVALGDTVSWRPVYVAALVPTPSLRWHGDVWALPPGTDIAPGSPVFTLDGAWAGLAVAHRGQMAIVPGSLVFARTEQLITTGQQELATLGVEAEWTSALVASAAGSRGGVVVTWVDPAGPSASHLAVADVIESVAGERLAVFDDWLARSLQFRPGQAVALGIRRRGDALVVHATPAAILAPAAVEGLGLTMRLVRREGAMVTAVQAGSLADRAGLHVGDLITAIGDARVPTPARVVRVVEGAAPGAPVLVAITRGSRRHVLALVK